MKSDNLEENYLTDKLNENFSDHDIRMVKTQENDGAKRKFIVLDGEVTSIGWDVDHVRNRIEACESDEEVRKLIEDLLNAVKMHVEVAILHKNTEMPYDKCIERVAYKYNSQEEEEEEVNGENDD